MLSLGTSALVAVCARMAFSLLGGASDPSVSAIIKLGLWLIPLYSLDTLGLSYLVARRHVKVYSLLALSRAYGQLALVYLFVGRGMGLIGAIQGTMLAEFAIGVLVILFAVKSIGLEFPRFLRIKEYLTYSMPTVPSLLSNWVVRSSDRYIISLLLGNVSVGAYSAAYGVGDSVYFFLAPLSMILAPTIFSLWEKDQKTRAREFMSRALKFFLLFAIPATFGVTFLARPILLILSTPQIADLGTMVVPIVASGMILLGIDGIMGQVFALHKDTKKVGFIWITAAVTNVIANFILVPLFGLVGAAIATLGSYLEALALIRILGRRYSAHFPEFPWRFTVKSMISSSLMVCVVAIARSQLDHYLGLLISILSGAILYFALMKFTKALDAEEIDYIRNLLRKR